MVSIPQNDFKNMMKLGILKTKQGEKNFAVVNKQKNSKVKTYYVEDQVAEDYYATVG